MGSIPFANPAGNNQTSPVANPIMNRPGTGTIPTGNPVTNPGANPFSVTPSSGAGTFSTPTSGSVPAGGVPNAGGLIQSPSNAFGTTGGLDKQLQDIYGKGVGGALGQLLQGMSGTDSTVLQEFIQSLQPQFAQQSANLSAKLGAGGVSANSSVDAIAQSNLSSQENALIANESAGLTQHQEDLTASLLSNMEGASAKEVATSGWSVFGDVMNQITGDIGNIFGGYYSTPGNKGGSSSNTPSGYGQNSTVEDFQNLPELNPNLPDQIFPT